MRLTGIALQLSLAMLLTACHGPDPATPVPLADLADHPAHWDGRRVIAEGRMFGLPTPEHYWIEDAAVNRVAVRPDAMARVHLGATVRVIGRFHHDRTRGRWIVAATVARTDSDP